jgi:hypothetical protein
MNVDSYGSRGRNDPFYYARINANRRDTDGGRHGSSRDYPVSAYACIAICGTAEADITMR